MKDDNDKPCLMFYRKSLYPLPHHLTSVGTIPASQEYNLVILHPAREGFKYYVRRLEEGLT